MYYSVINNAFINTPIWDDCVEVSMELHNQLMEEVTQGNILSSDVDGNPITVPPEPAEESSLPNKFLKRVAELNQEYEIVSSALRSTYPTTETTTWPVQVSEARIYRKWENGGSIAPAPETPFLSDLSTMRDERGVGTGLANLVDRVLVNNELYSPEIARLTAIRHAAEQALTVAAYVNESAEELAAVTWQFSV